MVAASQHSRGISEFVWPSSTDEDVRAASRGSPVKGLLEVRAQTADDRHPERLCVEFIYIYTSYIYIYRYTCAIVKAPYEEIFWSSRILTKGGCTKKALIMAHMPML